MQSDLVGALAEDHLNDVMSNIVAVVRHCSCWPADHQPAVRAEICELQVTAAIAANVHKVWWLDPAGEAACLQADWTVA